MIKQASVRQIRQGERTRKDGYVVITMCFYPRGIKKALRDEYRRGLAPDVVLFKDWQKHCKAEGHNAAFARADYQRRFYLSEEAYQDLKRLSEIGRDRDVYLVCQCTVGEMCHREILMLAARTEFKAPVDRIFNTYPVIERRLMTRKDGLRLARKNAGDFAK